MTQGRLYPRFAEARLVEALADTPVVLIHGPRQSGKTTLARATGDKAGYAYFSFDDEVILAGAKSDPGVSSQIFPNERFSMRFNTRPRYSQHSRSLSMAIELQADFS